MTLVAISAAYGAGGSRIAPLLAQQLGVPFVDRALPMQAAAQVQFPPEESESEGRPQPGWLERVLQGFVGAEASVTGPVATTSPLVSPDARRESDALLVRQAQSGRGVVLGRAAVAVLRDDPRVLRVRLYGPPERRIEQAVRTFGAERDVATNAVRNLDRTHDAYLQQFYGADIDDPALYHLMIDSTVVPVDACADIVARAARAHASILTPVSFGP
jgi:cytidylate kinase-like protein